MNDQCDEIRLLQEQMSITLKHLKSFHLTLSSLMLDVSAIRATVLKTSEAKARHKKNVATAMSKARPLIDEAMQSYDELILRADAKINIQY